VKNALASRRSGDVWTHGDGLTGRRGGQVVVKQVPKESFFNFFTAVEIPENMEDEDEENVSRTCYWEVESESLTRVS
jgi:hypothetical protein